MNPAHRGRISPAVELRLLKFGTVFGIGMTELMVILVIGLLVLGPKRLPDLARSLGRGLAEFRRASTDMRREFLDVAEDAKIDPLDLSAMDPAPGASDEEPGARTPLVQPSDEPEPEPEPEPADQPDATPTASKAKLPGG
jgi:Tat protein translocase TatB subunit